MESETGRGCEQLSEAIERMKERRRVQKEARKPVKLQSKLECSEPMYDKVPEIRFAMEQLDSECARLQGVTEKLLARLLPLLDKDVHECQVNEVQRTTVSSELALQLVAATDYLRNISEEVGSVLDRLQI